MKRIDLLKKTALASAIYAAVLSLPACGGGGNDPAPAPLAAADVQKSTTAWSFGVMGDTQWTLSTDPANANPNGVSASIIKQMNQQFIAKGVKFVVQVGDLTERGGDADVAARAAAAKDLYDAKIGFFPLRGNHETGGGSANGFAIPAFKSHFPQTQCQGANTVGASNCNSPAAVSPDLTGISYSFDYGPANGNARFVMVDNWATPSKNNGILGYTIGDQQTWISSRLDKASRNTSHAFVFSHQQPIGENHQDSLFGANSAANQEIQNAYFSNLQANQVKYHITGHDHVHQRSVIASPDGKSSLEELICASASSKYYTPKAIDDAGWAGQKVRETSLSQELYSPGFYIYTVDGTRVTVDYYSDATGGFASDAKYPGTPTSTVGVTPTLNFVKKETWGYSLNGKEFLIGGSGNTSYTTINDSFQNTTVNILSGAYGNKEKDATGRVLTRKVTTGWTVSTAGTFSDILTLLGMATPASNGQTETYTLSIKYDASKFDASQAQNGGIGIATPGHAGKWVNAVSRNTGGAAKFVNGPWQASYGLGTYGIDTKTHTAWAVVNFNGDFVVAPGLQ